MRRIGRVVRRCRKRGRKNVLFLEKRFQSGIPAQTVIEIGDSVEPGAQGMVVFRQQWAGVYARDPLEQAKDDVIG
jgi:hypothetical protein